MLADTAARSATEHKQLVPVIHVGLSPPLRQELGRLCEDGRVLLGVVCHEHHSMASGDGYAI